MTPTVETKLSKLVKGWSVSVFQRMRPGSPRWIVTAIAPDGNCYLEHSCGNKYPSHTHIAKHLMPGAVKRYELEVAA